MKSIDLCISRFDEDTKIAFLDLYTKVDSGVQVDYGQPETVGTEDDFDSANYD